MLRATADIGLVERRHRRARAYACILHIIHASIKCASHTCKARVTAFPAVHQFCFQGFYVARASGGSDQHIDQLSRFAPAVLSDIELCAFQLVALDLRRPGFQQNAPCLSIPTVQSDLDVSILCIDRLEQTTVDKLSPSCCALTRLLSSDMSAVP